MAETSQDNTLAWEKVESMNGATYEVSRTEHEVAAKAKVEEAAKNDKGLFGLFEGKNNFDIKIEWTVGADKMIATTQEVLDKASISAYRLTKGHMYYDYYLEFSNTKNYNYYFYDETGDCYPVNCYVTGNHTVRFDSKKPNIVRIIGN